MGDFVQEKPGPLRARDALLLAAYAAILLWINFYIARDFFSGRTAHMNSMHGFWAAMAQRGAGVWLHPSWWPYWDCGIPFEAAYAPLVPALTAAWAALFHTSFDMAFSSVTGLVYIFGPLALFAMAWGLTRTPGISFSAALIYALTSPTQWVSPDGAFNASHIRDARRLFLIALWDDTPHVTALALLPLAVLFLVFSVERRRWRYYAAAAVTIALMAMASAFGPVMTGMAAVAIIVSSDPAEWKRRALLIAGIGAWAYAIAIAFVPPSVLLAIHESTVMSDQERWTVSSLTALSAALLGLATLRHLLLRYRAGARTAFFVSFAWIAGSVPLTADYLGGRLMPQADRYKFEFELTLTLVAAVGGWALIRRFPTAIRVCAILLLVSLAAEQIADHRKREKEYTFPQDVTATVEYRAAKWTAQNLPGVRVFFPGSLAQWANDFTDIPQFTGGSWSMATNQSQQRADAAIAFAGRPVDQDLRISLVWLKAYGAGAIAVAAPDSGEYWKPYSDPGKFDGLAPLWTEKGVTIRRVPLRSTSSRTSYPRPRLCGASRRIPRIPLIRRATSPRSTTRRCRWHPSSGGAASISGFARRSRRGRRCRFRKATSPDGARASTAPIAMCRKMAWD
jgi:hypothetical protein